MRAAVLKQLLADRAAKRPVVIETDLAIGDSRLLYLSNNEPGELADAVRRALAEDQPQRLERDGRPLLLNPFNPPLRLIVVGAVHIAQSLSRMATLAGYDVFIVDPREAFAAEERFGGVTLVRSWPDEAMAVLDLDMRTAVVTLTHDRKLDDPALVAALARPCFYIGALGSRKTQAARLERLRRMGYDDEALARIHGPVGLPIGAATPEEIAVSILAQMTERLRRAPCS